MEAKFTKGEWKYSLDGKLIQVVIPTKFPTKLILGKLSIDDCSHPQCCKIEEHSNAKLIAAAPDMIKTLIEVDLFLSNGGSRKEIKEKIKKTIEKAT